jgi:hypothetical protein
MALQRLTGPVTVDGRIDEPAWEAVTALPLILLRPVFRGTPTERTTLRVAYDDEHLYVAGAFFDADPSGIRINSLYRDRYSNDDLLTVVLDPFNDSPRPLHRGRPIVVGVSNCGTTLARWWPTVC